MMALTAINHGHVVSKTTLELVQRQIAGEGASGPLIVMPKSTDARALTAMLAAQKNQRVAVAKRVATSAAAQVFGAGNFGIAVSDDDLIEDGTDATVTVVARNAQDVEKAERRFYDALTPSYVQIDCRVAIALDFA